MDTRDFSIAARLATVVLLASAVVAVPAAQVWAEADGATPGAPRRAAVALAAGGFHNCVRLADGQVTCWGWNAYGQLGLGDAADRGDQPGEIAPLPPIPLGRAATAVAVGGTSSCALLDDGSVKCWGWNAYGQLGQGDTADRGDQPGEIAALPAIPLGRAATEISVGGSHVCALLDDHTVKCWGLNGEGQLGVGDAANRGDGAGEIAGLPSVPLGHAATAITTGSTHTCALLDDATVKCWGDNNYGKLGIGDTADRGSQPGDVAAVPVVPLGRPATAIAGGDEHTCAVLDDATVKCWGRNTAGQLGQGDGADRGDHPGEVAAMLAVPLRRPVTAIAGGSEHTCALLDDGTTRCWGRNDVGVLGQGNIANQGDNPGEVFGLEAIPLSGAAMAVGTGSYHSCALLVDGTVRCWGGGYFGALGQGDTAVRGDQDGEVAALPAIALGQMVTPITSTPLPPRAVSAVGATGSAVVSWTAPADDGGIPLTGYRVERSIDGVWVAAGSTSATSLALGSITPGAHRFRVVATNALGESPPSNESVASVSGAGVVELVPLSPARLLDTRPGGATVDGLQQAAGTVPAGFTVQVRVAGRGGVPSSATAAVLNVTAVGPAAAGFATVHPCEPTPPNASNLNVQPGQDIANTVVAKLSGVGDVCISTSTNAHFLIDVNGYLPPGSPITPLTPARLLDTRTGGTTIDGESTPSARVPAGGVVRVPIAGRGGVPGDARTAIVNVTAVGPANAGYATLYPCDPAPPNASNLNYQSGQDIPNAVISRLSAGGEVCVYSSATADYIIDVNGASPPAAATTITPLRLLDTRVGGATADNLYAGTGVLLADRTIQVPIAGRAGVPVGATAAILNVTAVGPAAAGFATIHPCGEARPNASNLNYQPRQDIPNSVIAKLAADGTTCIYTSATSNYVIDVAGYLPS